MIRSSDDKLREEVVILNQSWGRYFKNVTSYILLCQKVTPYILLVTFHSNILHNLVTSYLQYAYECACRIPFSLK